MDIRQVRHQLANMMEQYLEALVEKNASGLSLAPNCRCTYNGKESKPGDNELWKNTLVIPQRQTFLDPYTKEVVFFGVTSNEALERVEKFPLGGFYPYTSYLFTVRLKMEEDQIVEIEELAQSGRARYFYGYPEDMNLPVLDYEIPIPQEEQHTREELIALAHSYWDACEHIVKPEELQIHPDAQRKENGFYTTNHTYTFRGDFKHNPAFKWFVPRQFRHVPVVDPARGVVITYSSLISDMNRNFCCRIAEVFKIKDGSICRVMAAFPFLDNFGGWEKDI